jgi:hypothetical protein
MKKDRNFVNFPITPFFISIRTLATRAQNLEIQLTDRIDRLNQPDTFCHSMPEKFLQGTFSELERASRISQQCYDFALTNSQRMVEFFERQSQLVDQVCQTFDTLPLETKLLFCSYPGPKKLAALSAICKGIDPLYDPVWHPFNPRANTEECLLQVHAMLVEVLHSGVHSPLFLEFLSQLAL